MNETVVSREELIKNADAILRVQEEMVKARMGTLFSKMSVENCRFVKSVWPELLTTDTIPENQVYLSTLQAESGLTMSEISQMVEKLNNQGIVIWERGESGTYIQLSKKGFAAYQTQQEILLSYVERVMKKIGKKRLKEMLSTLIELEDALASEMPKAE